MYSYEKPLPVGYLSDPAIFVAIREKIYRRLQEAFRRRSKTDRIDAITREAQIRLIKKSFPANSTNLRRSSLHINDVASVMPVLANL